MNFPKMRTLFLCTLFFPAILFAKTRTVDHVDLTRYLGTWYEIGSFPQRFSKGCHCTRAQYSLREDGDIAVLNTCNRDAVDGKLSTAHGVAKVVYKKSNAKLKVRFFWPFWGEYHIIGLDPEYRYAVVSNEEGSTLWILSRTPELAKALLDQALEVATKNNLDKSQFQYQVQKGCNYPTK